MTSVDPRALRRQLQQEFPDLDLHRWYVQFRELKASQPDAVLLYRLGDFYETFDDDAKLAAELLDVTLTYKEFGSVKNGERRRCPMAGMPYHAIESYIARLVGAGYRVAIAEQVSETASSRSDTRPRSRFAAGLEQTSAVKGMVDRKVVRIITPGTIVDSGMVADERNNYLVALIASDDAIGLAYADLTTGEFVAADLSGPQRHALLDAELARLMAAEILVPDKADLRVPGIEPASARLRQDLEFMTKDERDMLLPGERVARRIERENTARWAHGHITAWAAWRWEQRTARDALLQHLRVRTLAGYGMADAGLAARAAGALLQYALETQNGAAAHLASLRAYTPGDVMLLDPQTRRNLELLEGSGGNARNALVGVLDQSRTPMGARLIRRWIAQPLLNTQRIAARHDTVARFVADGMLRATLREELRRVGDMERIVNRLVQGATVVTPRDVVRLRDALRALPAIMAALGDDLPAADDGGQTQQAASLQDGEWADAGRADGRGWADAGAGGRGDAGAGGRTQHAASLRDGGNSRRVVQPRYDMDDLFGDDGLFANDGAPDDDGVGTQHAASVQDLGAIPDPGAIDICADVLALLDLAIDDEPPALLGASNYLRDGGDGAEPVRRVIRPGFDAEMDEVVRANRDAQNWITQLEPKEQERTGLRTLRVDYNKVFGYYIEVPRAAADRVPADYIRRQTLANAERYVTQDLKIYEDVVLRARERLTELERLAFARVAQQVAAHGTRLLHSARRLAEIDAFASLAEAAARGGYTRPIVTNDARLQIHAGRHPVVERALDTAFVPNDTTLDCGDERILLVTGPNMSGKSTVLRQTALIVLMAQIGSFVPAAHAAIGLVDRIFTRIGAQDDIATGSSTFMVEMTETAAILAQSTPRSLIILDEVGRGTSTYDGMAIARALVEYLHGEPRLGCRTLFATHYHELTDLAALLPHVANYHMAAIEQDSQVVFLHELRPGSADRSYGIHVAELAGMPRAVIRRASALLAELEAEGRAGLKVTTPAPPTVPAPAAPAPALPHPVLAHLRALPINELTPIEALTRLYELQQLAKG